MIYFALDKKEGAQRLILKYNLRYVDADEFIPGEQVASQLTKNVRSLTQAFSRHETIHAFVLPDSSIYFHPDTVVEKLKEGYKKYYEQFIY